MVFGILSSYFTSSVFKIKIKMASDPLIDIEVFFKAAEN